MNAEVFAMDLSSSVDAVQSMLNKTVDSQKFPVHIVQANVHSVPFKNQIFDLVFSSGVLHHTPDTYTGFRCISEKLKKGGICYIDVYSTEHKSLIEFLVFKCFNVFRKVTTRLPYKMLHVLCFLLVPMFFCIQQGPVLLPEKDGTKRGISRRWNSVFSMPYHHFMIGTIQPMR